MIVMPLLIGAVAVFIFHVDPLPAILFAICITLILSLFAHVGRAEDY